MNDNVNNWRRKTNIELFSWLLVFIAGILSLLWLADWKIGNAEALYTELKANLIFSSVVFLLGSIFSAITFRKWYDKNHNHSNIENYKKGLKIPEALKDVE